MPPSRSLIVVIEDEESMRTVVEMALEEAGYFMRTAPDGAAGLAALTDWSPHLIVLDLKMPSMDGWEFLQAYQQRGDALAPVIACTDLLGVEQEALAAGAVAFIDKPYDLDLLLAVVEQHLGTAPPMCCASGTAHRRYRVAAVLSPPSRWHHTGKPPSRFRTPGSSGPYPR